MRGNIWASSKGAVIEIERTTPSASDRWTDLIQNDPAHAHFLYCVCMFVCVVNASCGDFVPYGRPADSNRGSLAERANTQKENTKKR